MDDNTRRGFRRDYRRNDNWRSNSHNRNNNTDLVADPLLSSPTTSLQVVPSGKRKQPDHDSPIDRPSKNKVPTRNRYDIRIDENDNDANINNTMTSPSTAQKLPPSSVHQVTDFQKTVRDLDKQIENPHIALQKGSGSSTSRGRSRSNRGPRRFNENRQNLEEEFKEQDRNDQRKFDEVRQRQILGFKRLEALLSEDADVICVTLRNPREGFSDLLKANEVKEDWVVVILKLAEKVVKASTIENNVKDVVIVVCNYFIKHIVNYVLHIPLQSQLEKSRNKYYWRDPKSFWQSLIVVCNKIIQLIPRSATDHLPKLIDAIQMVKPLLESRNNPIDSESLSEIDKIQEQLAIILSEITSKNKSDDENDEEEKEMPLGDFRGVSILPTPEEILVPERPEIRENKIKGKYISVNHYLDVQFRLLREDFIAPLREGICNYLVDRNLKKYDNIRIYGKVTFQSTDFLQNKFSCIVDLNLPKRVLDRIENSKRLLYGSLLVFTADEFKTTVLATVANRDTNLLRKGQIGVELVYSEIRIEHLLGKQYKMIESEIYFEPYYQVLKSLQTITEENFPLKKYIIDLEIESKPPKYLEDNSHLNIKNWEINILSSFSWVPATHLGYDDTQYNAFRSALTKEFSVIQGPPGTGKTFIGLEIVNVLLTNNSIWYKETPILIVCYTNHALDQFLEGILKMTNRVVRVGAQSKNENMAKINIRELRRTWKIGNTLPHMYRQLAYQIRMDMKDCLSKIKNLQMSLQEIYDNNCIIDVKEELSKKNIKFNNSQDFFEWLLDRTNYSEQRAIAAEQRRLFQIGLNQDNADVPTNANAEENNELNELEMNIEEEVIDENDELREVIDDADDILSEIDFSMYSQLRRKTWKIKSFEDDLENLWIEYRAINDSEDNANNDKIYRIYNTKLQLEQKLIQLDNLLKYIKFRLQQNIAELPAPKYQVNDGRNLDPNDRWSLYWDCISIYRKQLFRRLGGAEDKYKRLNAQHEEIQQVEDSHILKSSLVVGMTTTGAAKYHTVLQGIKSPIVIVEEAAEVLESHIVTSLTGNCQHLILIGDHKQLRPSTAVYRLAKHFNLDISLFERMVKNGMHCDVLGVQHRMRPEFAKLIVPTIYPKLENHPSVLSYENIIGVTKNLFFVTHNHFEEKVEDSESKQNYHEAKFLLCLCRHLLLQGYKPEDITILTTYNGQMFYMRKERNKMESLRDVRITVVDNFQGEENKIILLSLVRSNADAKIGFLGIENRICVALSRAKEGMYIIGNMNNLEKSPVWQKIKKELEQQDAIGDCLALQCKIHPDQMTYVSRAEDFQKCPEGGCTLVCNLLLPCGHSCTSLCHVQNREHEDYKCLMRCTKVLCERNHQCPDLCYKQCAPCKVPVHHTLPCGHEKHLPCFEDPKKYQCREIVKTELPCGHVNKKPCFADEQTYPCSYSCESRLECGHKCAKLCHTRKDPEHLEYECRKPCAGKMKNCSMNHTCPKLCYEECTECTVRVVKLRNCGHSNVVMCCQDVNEVPCTKPCSRNLTCGHRCLDICSNTCDQSKCKRKVEKSVPVCGHVVKIECGKEPDRINCTNKCPLKLPCGHICSNKCATCAINGCSQKCQTLVPHKFETDCGHCFDIPCFKSKMSDLPSYSTDLLRYCKAPCNKLLECEHMCEGTCGKCFQGRFHLPCKSKCGVTLICGHSCEVPCRVSCPPCKKNCELRCGHSKCPKKCGAPCKPCTELCEWRCVHYKCTKKCGEKCDRPPCNEKCEKKLKCGHECIGLCGENCPTLCRECDNEIVTEIFFGDEDEPDARFIQLEGCNHAFEVNSLDNYFKNYNLSDSEDGGKKFAVKVLECPRCKSPVYKSLRYGNIIKEIFDKVSQVKKRSYGSTNENLENARALIRHIDMILKNNSRALNILNTYTFVLQEVRRSLMIANQPKNKNRSFPINAMDLSLFDAQVNVIGTVLEIVSEFLDKYTLDDSTNILVSYAQLIGTVLNRQSDKISKQEMNDILKEIQRMRRIKEFCEMISSREFSDVKNLSEVKTSQKNILNKLLRAEIYTSEYDDFVKNDLIKFGKLIKSHMQVSDATKKEIIRILHISDGVKQNAWYTCPNGHLYCISACGGAMERSICIECKEVIGGENHRLVSTNRHASSLVAGPAPWPPH